MPQVQEKQYIISASYSTADCYVSLKKSFNRLLFHLSRKDDLTHQGKYAKIIVSGSGQKSGI